MRIKFVALFIMLSLTSCSMPTISQEDADFAWQMFCRENPECKNTKKPMVVILEMPIYIYGEKALGYYCKRTHTIYLTEESDMSSLVHEYNHACGNHMGEKPYSSFGFR